ncbi:hypothetical protein J0656_05950 [Muricauda ruestringensis]|uniref:Uncharacterized protein n=1 Tax=Flagellimonas aurea TaxID=2915619 RepID=A0ABS3G2C3_9FLAO|nr:hypothetical protein [Allomuricauda aurea]MBO0353555.1 hypothetical protein [Allomuricauda aurea]
MMTEWHPFYTALILIVLIYYSGLLIWISYHRFKDPPRQFPVPKKTESTDNPVPFEETPDETFLKVEELSETIKKTIATAFGNHYNRSELLDSLATVLRQYPSLHHFPFKAAIHELITSECEKYGPVGLRDNELKDLWQSGPDRP